MPDKNTLTLQIGIATIIVTLGIGTCSTNGRIGDVHRRLDDMNQQMDDGFNNLQRQIEDSNRRMNDGFNNVNQRIDDTNRRIDDTNQRIDDVQDDVREIRSMLFETLKSQPPAD